MNRIAPIIVSLVQFSKARTGKDQMMLNNGNNHFHASSNSVPVVVVVVDAEQKQLRLQSHRIRYAPKGLF